MAVVEVVYLSWFEAACLEWDWELLQMVGGMRLLRFWARVGDSDTALEVEKPLWTQFERFLGRNQFVARY